MSDHWQAAALFNALHRGSLLCADSLGLTLTAQELEAVRKQVVVAWVAEQIGPKFTVNDWLRRCYGEETE